MSQYTVYITPEALRDVKNLPGYVRQRVKRVIDGLAANPQPYGSKDLTVPEGVTANLRRIRLDKWRVIYTVSEADKAVDVLAVRKRPPYDYGDFETLLAEVH